MVGLETLLGTALGGLFRFGQAVLEAREKARDRDHEFRMTELQGQQAERAGERRLREIGLEGDYRLATADAEALVAGVRAQSEEARAAGGFTAALSASVRPVVTYLLVLPFVLVQLAEITAAFAATDVVAALRLAVSESDMAILSSILSFWFVDRSMRHRAAAPA